MKPKTTWRSYVDTLYNRIFVAIQSQKDMKEGIFISYSSYSAPLEFRIFFQETFGDDLIISFKLKKKK
jgi:hypothetical protein